MCGIVDKGYAPTVEEIAAQFKCPIDEAEFALKALAEYHVLFSIPTNPRFGSYIHLLWLPHM